MPALDPPTFYAKVRSGSVPVDLRPPQVSAGCHVPGALLVQFSPVDLAARAERLVPKDRPVVLVVEPTALGPVAERIFAGGGWSVGGFLEGGMAAWQAAGLPVDAIATTTPGGLRPLVDAGAADVLDVREPEEYAAGHIPGARNLPHREVWRRAAELDHDRHWFVTCGTQTRAGAAASILKRLGFRNLTIVLGGTRGWIAEGHPLER